VILNHANIYPATVLISGKITIPSRISLLFLPQLQRLGVALSNFVRQVLLLLPIIFSLLIFRLFMQLILWRHAEAEDCNVSDLARNLTPKGQHQAAAMANWLKSQIGRDIENWRVIASPANRTRQTADTMQRAYDIEPNIAPDAMPDAVLEAAGWPDAASNVIVVGHQPTLGMVIARLMNGGVGLGRNDEAEVSVKKGAVWWFELRERNGVRQTLLKAMVTPQNLGS
jgi:phosphohistidine phosphatase